jgi:hypothetical protein
MSKDSCPAPRNQNCAFSFDNENLVIRIVDTSKVQAKVKLDIEYIRTRQDTYAADTYAAYYKNLRLPMQIFDFDLLGYARNEYYSEPSFGAFIYGVNCYVGHDPVYIFYCPSNTLTWNERDEYYEVDNKPVCSLVTQDKDYILVNSDGEVVETEIIFSKDNNFKIKHGTLKATQLSDLLYYPHLPGYFYTPHLTWTYVADPALKTKSAAMSADIQELY